MFPWQQLDTTVMGSSVLYAVCAEVLSAENLGVIDFE
jgi:hypothetical protein